MPHNAELSLRRELSMAAATACLVTAALVVLVAAKATARARRLPYDPWPVLATL